MNTQEIKRGEYNAYYPISEVKLADSKQRYSMKSTLKIFQKKY